MERIFEIFCDNLLPKAESNVLRPLIYRDSVPLFVPFSCVKPVSTQSPSRVQRSSRQETCLTHLCVPESTWRGPWHIVGAK